MGFFSNLFGRNKLSNKTDNIIDTENVNSEFYILSSNLF